MTRPSISTDFTKYVRQLRPAHPLAKLHHFSLVLLESDRNLDGLVHHTSVLAEVIGLHIELSFRARRLGTHIAHDHIIGARSIAFLHKPALSLCLY